MEPVLTGLTKLIFREPDIELLNFYKSYPVVIRGMLLKLDSEGNGFARVSPPGSVCLYQSKTTILLSNGLTEAVRARINRFDILEGVVVLNNFLYMGSWSGRRMLVRVQPSSPIHVILEKDSLTVRGQALDLSLTGIGVLVSNPIVKKSETYQVRIMLPAGEITLPGTILEVIPHPPGVRLSIKFTASSRDVASIIQYVTDRRAEIQDEVVQLYERVYRTAQA